MDSVTPGDFARWVAGLTTKAGRPMKPGSKVTASQPVRQFFAWACRQDPPLCRRDPTAEIERPKVPEGEPKALTRAQVAKLLAAAPDHQWRTMIRLTVCLGLRIGDLAAMRVEHWHRDVQELVLPASKGGDVWVVATDGEAGEVLASWIDHGLDGACSGWMFPSSRREGEPYDRGWIGANFRRIARRAGVPGSAHWLRHTTGTELDRSGVSPAVGMRIMRHKTMGSYQIYTRANLSDTRRVLAERPHFRPSRAAQEGPDNVGGGPE